MLQKLILAFCIVISAISCKKETTDNGGNNSPVAASTLLNVAYGTDPLQKMDVYLPANRTTTGTKVMILIHGGAWAGGDKNDFSSFIDSVKTRWPAYAVFNINYRLSSSGNNTFPTQELDTRAAVDFIYNRRTDYLISDNFTTVGASAGAHLALLQAYKNSNPVKVKLVVDFFGPADMFDLYNNAGIVPPSAVAEIVGATPASNPSVYTQSSPVTYATSSSACPTIILQGSADILVNADRQSKALRNALIAAGVPVTYVEYPGKGHGTDWDSTTYFDAFNKIQAFIHQYNP